MKKNILLEKSFQFALKSIEMYKVLIKSRNEYIMSKQFLKSSTSVGANFRESQNAQSKADFIHKLSIAQKEGAESIYWLELLFQSEYITHQEFYFLHTQASELLKIIKSIIISTKKGSEL